MRKVGMTLAAALALAVAGTGAASASTITGPCTTQQNLFDKYNIQFDMHQEQVEQTYSFVCSKTG